MAMRIQDKAFLSCTILAGVLLAAAGVMAADPPPPPFCNTANGYHIEAVGPTSGPCNLSGTGGASNTCTSIEYTISGGTASPDHVAAFVRAEATLTFTAPVASVSTDCEGDPAIGVAADVVCHEHLVRWNNQQTKADKFGVEASGTRGPITTSLVVKKGRSSVGSCKIVGLGFEGVNPFKPLAKFEDVKFKGCTVRFTFDSSGGLGSAVLLGQSPGGSDKPKCSDPGSDQDNCCSEVISANLDKLSLKLDPSVCPAPCELGPGAFATDSYISTGSNSCTTRIIGGRLTTWGSPCPQ